MHGRPRPKKGAAEDPEKLRKQKQRVQWFINLHLVFINLHMLWLEAFCLQHVSVLHGVHICTRNAAHPGDQSMICPTEFWSCTTGTFYSMEARQMSLHTQAALYGQLAAEVLGRRAAGRSDPESLTLAAKLLELNPEVYTVWNYRCVCQFACIRAQFIVLKMPLGMQTQGLM